MTNENSKEAQNVPAKAHALDNMSRTFRIRRRGASAVEFAVVAPIFFLLIFGMIEYGRMIMVQQVITNASREGARRAVLDGATDSAVRTTVQNYLDGGRVTGTSRTVTISPTLGASVAAGTAITVTVSISFNDVSWLPAPFFLNGRVMTSSTTMRKESSS